MLDRRSIFAAAVAAAPLLVAWHGASAAADMTEGEATAFIQQLGEQSITVLRASAATLAKPLQLSAPAKPARPTFW